jgi:SNF2 family DNA or RNA helicase
VVGATETAGRILTSSGPLHVSVSVSPASSGWTVTIGPSRGSQRDNQRLLRLAAWLCELDAFVARRLQEGRVIERFIPTLDLGAVAQSSPGGVHRAVDLVRPLLLPRRVNDSLYPYQRRGVAWLLRKPRALLADDMGLGKTAQSLAALRRLIRFGRMHWAVVAAPRTLVPNWIAEARRWAPELAVSSVLVTGAERAETWRRAVRRSHIIVTSYEQFREPPEALIDVPPDLYIADEAHRLRRTESQATQGFKMLRARSIWALTGTPVERDAEDLAVLMSILDPRRFSSMDRDLHQSELRARARPYILRRRKEDVLPELPAVLEEEEEVALSDAQRRAYHEAIRRHSMSGDEGSFLALFNELRSLCDLDPASGDSSKLDRIVELLEDIAEVGEKAVVFSYLLEPLRALAQRLTSGTSVDYTVIRGDMSLDERGDAIELFKKEPRCTALLASTRVASEGLNLTEANHVLFVNRWWNPSANAQARDRVVRIGQQNRVWVHTFVCRGTVETRLGEILRRKALTFDSLVDAISERGAGDVEELFAEPE